MNCIMINLDSRRGYQLKTHSSLQDKQSMIQGAHRDDEDGTEAASLLSPGEQVAS